MAVGFFGGLFGVSGGAISITVLGLVGLPQQLAQGTSLVMQVPNVALAIRSYAKRGKIDVPTAIALAVASFPFTALGAFVATHMASAPLRRAFVVFLVSLATYTLWNALRKPKSAQLLAFTWPYAAALGAVGGFVTGLFGVGGAGLAIPTLVLVFGLTQTAAQGMALILAFPGTIVGLITYGIARDVDWAGGIALAIGGAMFVGAGVALAHRLPEKTLRLAFCAFLYSVATLLWLHA